MFMRYIISGRVAVDRLMADTPFVLSSLASSAAVIIAAVVRRRARNKTATTTTALSRHCRRRRRCCCCCQNIYSIFVRRTFAYMQRYGRFFVAIAVTTATDLLRCGNLTAVSVQPDICSPPKTSTPWLGFRFMV